MYRKGNFLKYVTRLYNVFGHQKISPTNIKIRNIFIRIRSSDFFTIHARKKSVKTFGWRQRPLYFGHVPFVNENNKSVIELGRSNEPFR